METKNELPGQTPGITDPQSAPVTVDVPDAPTSVATKQVDALFDSIRKNIDLKEFTADDMWSLTQKVVEFLATNKELTGVEKKDLVSHLMIRLYNEIPPSNNEKLEIFRSMVQSGLPHIIELAYKFVMEKFDLNKDGKISCDECKTVWARWCSCCNRHPPIVEKDPDEFKFEMGDMTR